MINDELYIIFDVSEINKIDFNQVEETSENTLRKSVNKLKTFVKWVGSTPTCVQNLTTKVGPYTHEQMSIILSTTEWSSNSGPIGYCQ